MGLPTDSLVQRVTDLLLVLIITALTRLIQKLDFFVGKLFSKKYLAIKKVIVFPVPFELCSLGHEIY